MYDAIIVGARCAGSPTAMLLARHGFKVLLVERTTFPSDTISTHILWPHGAEVLSRWGLLERLAATGAPPICRRMTFDVGPFALRGAIPDANDGTGGFCPRRTVLDGLLANAASAAGVDLREGFTVDELLTTGDTVVGIKGHGRDGRAVEERARLVIGADGVNSFVARSVRAQEYDVRPVAAYHADGWKPVRYDPAAAAYVKYLLHGVLPDDIRMRLIDSLFAQFVSDDEAAFASELYFTVDECREIHREVLGRRPRRFPMPVWMFERVASPDLTTMWRWWHDAKPETDTRTLREIHPGALTVGEWLERRQAAPS